MKLLYIAVALALGGCAGPRQQVTMADVAVSVPCIDAAPAKPVYQTGKGTYPGEKRAAVILADDFEKADQYGLAWEVASIGCVKPPLQRNPPLPATSQ